MELLVLGGTHHVGRNVVDVALARNDTVTTLNRGRTGPSNPAVRHLVADRADIASALGDATWDAVIDTWSGAPAMVATAVEALAGRIGHYGYVSSRSVYRWPIEPGMDETGPIVDGDPSSTDDTDYAAAKRGGELAVLNGFGEAALVARAGLILGPYELIGRLPWWLRRIERGGRVLCPGPPDLPLQYIDGRDLAAWMLDMAEAGRGGVFNTVGPPGNTTMGELLETSRTVTGSDATLEWVTAEVVERHGIQAWTELPIWLPPTGPAAALHSGNVTAAIAAGLRCRPIGDTVAATWQWLQAEGDPESLTAGSIGLDPAKERLALP